MRRNLLMALMIPVIGFSVSRAYAENDQLIAAGKDVFSRCQACHEVEPGLHIFGPSLSGIIGRKVGDIDDYDYSKSLEAMDFAWTPDRIKELLGEPAQNMLPGTKMVFPGFSDESKVDALIAYLQTI